MCVHARGSGCRDSPPPRRARGPTRHFTTLHTFHFPERRGSPTASESLRFQILHTALRYSLWLQSSVACRSHGPRAGQSPGTIAGTRLAAARGSASGTATGHGIMHGICARAPAARSDRRMRAMNTAKTRTHTNSPSSLPATRMAIRQFLPKTVHVTLRSQSSPHCAARCAHLTQTAPPR